MAQYAGAGAGVGASAGASSSTARTLLPSGSLAGPSAHATVISPASPLRNRALTIKQNRLKVGANVGSISRNAVSRHTPPDQRGRANVETANAETQVTRLWGDSSLHCCYICGFPIAGSDEKFPNTSKQTRFPRWGQGVGEHIIPAAGGFGYVGLFQTDYARGIHGEWMPKTKEEENEKEFLKHEMRWAHQWCNQIKSNILFTHFDDNDGLIVLENEIRNFIDNLWRGQVNEEGRRVYYGNEYGIQGNNNTEWFHLIHYWLDRCSQKKVSNEAEWRQFVKTWKQDRFKHIYDIVNSLCIEVNNHAKFISDFIHWGKWQDYLATNYTDRIINANEDHSFLNSPAVHEWQQLSLLSKPILNKCFDCETLPDLTTMIKPGPLTEAEVWLDKYIGRFETIDTYYKLNFENIKNSFKEPIKETCKRRPSNSVGARVIQAEDFCTLDDGIRVSRTPSSGDIHYLLIPSDKPQVLYHYSNHEKIQANPRNRKTRKRNRKNRKV